METTMTTLEPRIANPAFAVPGAMDALEALKQGDQPRPHLAGHA
jgi:hypothetical protein